MTEATDTQIDQSVSTDEAKAERIFSDGANNEQPKPDNQPLDQEQDQSEGAGERSLLKGESQPEDETKGDADSEAEKNAEEKQSTEYELKLGENALINETAIDRIKEIAQQHELSNEAAQATLDLADALLVEAKADSQKEWDNVVAGWGQEVENHPQLGGEHLAQTDRLATMFVQKYGPDGFLEYLVQGGFNKNPMLIETFVNAAKATLPDQKPTENGDSIPSKEVDDSPEAKAQRIFSRKD